MEQHDDFDDPEWAQAEIERLRKIVLTDDAAIEEVQAENARLRAALEKINWMQYRCEVCKGQPWEVAHEALRGAVSADDSREETPP